MYNPKKGLSYNKVNAIRNVFTYAPDKSDIIIDIILRHPNVPLDFYQVSAHMGAESSKS